MKYTLKTFYLILAAIAFVIGCKKENDSTLTSTEIVAQIQIISGDSMTAEENTALVQACKVQVLNAKGMPIKGVKVYFNITEGGGSVSPANAISDQDGFAEATWTLGSKDKAVQKLEAKAENKNKESIIGSPLTFTAFVQKYYTDTRDGKKYKIITIGNQTWFAENLNYKTSNSFCYENKESNCDTYGRLYLWSSVQTACPSGWHVPSDPEWMQLEIYLGLPADKAEEDGSFRDKLNIGGKFKSTTGWNYGVHGGATNVSGFSALPGGYRTSIPEYYNIGNQAVFWTTTQYLYFPDRKLVRHLNHENSTISKYEFLIENGASCRCLKN
jgi:uncharacterized protein (TIGR02145 family)